MQLRRNIARLAPGAILVAGCAVFVVYAYPGYMSYDSAWQLREARSGVLTDWHPPVMAAIWHWIDRVVPGPAGMLALQTGCFVAGLWALFARRFSATTTALLVVAILLFPPIGATLAVIWKDSQMLAFLVAGVALVTSESRARKLAGLGVLVLATAMRHNAFTITAGLVIPLFAWNAAAPRLRRYALATAVWLATTAAAFGVNAWLTDEQTHPWHASLAMFDIVGTLRFAPAMTDDEVRAALDGTVFDHGDHLQDKARAAYDPHAGVFKTMRVGFLAQPTDDAQRAAMARAWRTLVLGHPGAYFRHRARAFRELLALRGDGVREAIYVGYDDTSPFVHAPSTAQAALQAAALACGTSWLMRPFVYLVVLLCLVPFVVRARDRLVVSFVASSLLSEAALFFLAPTPDFRYSIWLVFSTIVVAVMVFAQRRERGVLASARKRMPIR